ncbi:MAG TPA: phage baseplate assembly protein V [Archangium sp.]|uniref:phage baseplate assembly protein V n=1 Tax=Archangium sp. TaxID=1872627 RepID=UPI002E31F8E9|nr:phage baseplate assembly protein V [Archangium sp.]HEX5749543.1 phage baseplate assembly protein V [Archangium sp.]
MGGHQAFEAIIDERVPEGLGGRMYGLYPALVTDVKDPDNQGRVKVVLPWAPDTAGARYEAWARLVTFMAGNNRGSWFIPDVNDEVLVGFEAGDPRRPYVLGALWNGTDAPPDAMDGQGLNARKVLRSRNGVKITLDDSDGKETLLLETPAGQKVTLLDSPASIEVKDSNGNTVKLEAAGISITTPSSARLVVNTGTMEVTASNKLSVTANTVEVTSAGKVSATANTVEVTSASKLTVNAAASVEFNTASFKVTAGTLSLTAGTISATAGISQFAGLLRADIINTNTVISPTYTPGGGNTL